jgi:general secretion pathway protein D
MHLHHHVQRHRQHADRRTGVRLIASWCGSLAALALIPPLAFAQEGRPGVAEPQPAANGAATPAAPAAPNQSTVPSDRLFEEGPAYIVLKDEVIGDRIFSIIMQATGKVVIPVNPLSLNTKKVTVVHSAPVNRKDAYDLLVQALRYNDVGVVEMADIVIVGTIDDLMTRIELPVLDADVDIRYRKDKGSLVKKIFKLWKVKAEELGEQLVDQLPPYASLVIDANSNQLVVKADIGFCQHIQTLIEELDEVYVQPETRTFRLAHADAQQVADQITELFPPEDASTTSGGAQRTPRPPRGSQQQSQPTAGSPPGPVIELRVTVSTQQNSVTVVGDPTDVEKIGYLIQTEWDLPRSAGTSRIYTLYYTDPMKIAEMLNNLLGGGGGSGGTRGVPRRTGGAGGAGGQGASVEQILSGIYQIEPYSDANQLIVFAKTEQCLDFLDGVIADLDQPSTIGLPFVIELKHANAIELSEELNALLSPAGSGVTIERPDEGLGGREEGDGAGGTDGGGTAGSSGGSAGQINFPWQRGGRQDQEQSDETSLIGKVRLVPIVRQNALAVLTTPPHREAVRELIEYFDQPGRQVVISAIIAAVQLTDDLALGIRFSSSDDILSGGGNRDNLLAGVFGFEGSEEDIFPDLFDTSVLNVNANINVVLQALAQKTNVRILQEPLIYTADNQEALFFDGQDIPFITNTTINTQGNPTDSFEYREVGVTLNVRPRITVERDVDLEILLELSNIVPGQTLFGGAIVDRRETRTHVIVQNGQTILISGIMRDEETKITRKVPGLGDLPLIGELFKSRENNTTTTELIAFITPHVIDNPSAHDDDPAQQQYRDRLRGLDRPMKELEQERRENPLGRQLIEKVGAEKGERPAPERPEPVAARPTQGN